MPYFNEDDVDDDHLIIIIIRAKQEGKRTTRITYVINTSNSFILQIKCIITIHSVLCLWQQATSLYV